MYDETYLWCSTCQHNHCMRLGALLPRPSGIEAYGTIGYTCRYCGTCGWGPGSCYGSIYSYERGPISVELDGNAWCAKRPETFVNLQESLAGFGDTRLNAVKALLAAEQAALAAKETK